MGPYDRPLRLEISSCSLEYVPGDVYDRFGSQLPEQMLKRCKTNRGNSQWKQKK